MGERLKGKVAVVTGAGRGIGRGIAHADGGGRRGGRRERPRRRRRRRGQRHARRPTRWSPRSGPRADARSRTTTASPTSPRPSGIVDTAVQEFGRLDILVNNAGILRDRMIFNMSEEEWDAVVARPPEGHASTAPATPRRACASRRAGASSACRRPRASTATPARRTTAPPRTASPDFTRVVSRDLGKYGITVNAIAPAAATRMTATVGDAARQARAKSGVAGMGAEARSLLPRPQREPDDVAPFVVYLASDAAADINGQIFVVMGGIISLLNYPGAGAHDHQADALDAGGDRGALPVDAGDGPVQPGAGAEGMRILTTR